MQGMETSGKGTNGKLTIMPSSTTRLSYISSSSLLFPSISFSFLSFSFFSSSSSSFSSSFFSFSSLYSSFSSLYSSFSSSFRKFGRPLGPPSWPAWTCRTGAYRSGLLLPQGYKIFIGSRLFTGTIYLQVSQVSQDTDIQIV